MATVDLDTLFRARTVVVEDPRRASGDTWSPPLVVRDHTSQYPRAFYQWMTELPSSNTRRAYTRAWSDLLRHTGKHPWDITSSDVRDWVEDLSTRPRGKPCREPASAASRSTSDRGERAIGYASATINQYIAAISSFYRFAMERCPIVIAEGRRTTRQYVTRSMHNEVRQ